VQPPESASALGEPLYEAFYGFREQPFALSTDPRFLFLSASHRRAYDELLTGLRRREGILLLTGETGTGKTTLCRALMDALGHRTFAALIQNPYMTDGEVLRVVLRDFGLVSRDEIRRGVFAKADTPQLLDTLEGFLRSLIPLDSYAVLIIDEAQSLAPTVLDQVRMLGGYEQDGRRLLQIVLVGQPLLSATLRSEAMRALNERITRRTALLPLRADEVEEYISHRLAIAGARDSVRFQPEAVRLIADRAHGLPRRVNMLCDRALEEGRISGKNEIDPELVKRAARSVAGDAAPAVEATEFASEPSETEEPPAVEMPLAFGVEARPRPGRARFWTLVAVGIVVVAGAIFGAGYDWSVVSADPGMPPLPHAPKLSVGGPPPVRPVPSEDDVKAMLAQMSGS
jgi:general secretion pathway protein A